MGQPTPLVSHPAFPRPKTGRNLTAGEVSGDTESTYDFANTRRVQPCPFWRLKSSGTTSLLRMEDAAALLAVVRPFRGGRACASDGERCAMSRRS